MAEDGFTGKVIPENGFTGEIDSVKFTFIRPSLHKLYPLQFIYYTCGKCGYRIPAEEAWVKAHGTFYRGVYCDICKKQEEGKR